jgi:hypothetical protein
MEKIESLKIARNQWANIFMNSMSEFMMNRAELEIKKIDNAIMRIEGKNA